MATRKTKPAQARTAWTERKAQALRPTRAEIRAAKDAERAAAEKKAARDAENAKLADAAREAMEQKMAELRRMLDDAERIAKFYKEVSAEIGRARRKFPQPNLNMAALTEEVGELAQALLAVRAGDLTWKRVRAEAVQVAAMAVRLALEGDPSIATPTAGGAETRAETAQPARDALAESGARFAEQLALHNARRG